MIVTRRTIASVVLLSAALESAFLVWLATSEYPTPKGVLFQIAETVIPTPAPCCPPKVVLSESERDAIEALRRRGASVTVFWLGGVLVHFPLGQLEREWRRTGTPPFRCGVSIAYSFSPDDTGPPMTDAALEHLKRLPTLTRVNLAGTRVTPSAIALFQQEHPSVIVEARDE